MPTADGDVVEEDVAVGVATGRRGRLVEQETRAGVRSPFDDEQRRTDRQPFDSRHRGLGARLGGSVQFIEEVGAEDRCRLHGDFVRGLVVVLVRHPLLLTGRCCAVWLGLLDRLPTRCDRRCDDRTAHRSPMCRPPPDRRRHLIVPRPGGWFRRAQGTITRVIRPACRGRPRRPADRRTLSAARRRRPEGRSASRAP